MRNHLTKRLMFAGALAASLAGGAHATVKDGVEAWQAGNFNKAIGEWRAPAQSGDPDAQFNLAQAYKLGRGVPADLAIAQSWYRKAADQGHEQAQANLGLILFQNGDRKGALPWIEKAAARGEPRAQYVLGTALFNGDLTQKDWPRAYALMTRAAAAGLPQATSSLAEMDRYIPLGQRQQGQAIARDLPRIPAPAPVQMAAKAPPPGRAVEMIVAKPAVAPRVTPAAAPAPKRAAPAAVAPPAAVVSSSGGWKVQLGAFGTPAAARSAWGGYSRLGGLSGLKPVYVSAGAITRLQAGGLPNKAAAERACAAAKSAAKGCFA
ncbi:MAG: hypothetical protein JWN59_738, partial [Sphingomonas bacterium]|nr:hypothetical protein [Sphingomonas bacterium]